MGQSVGAGSPVWFLCPEARAERLTYRSTLRTHTVRLTGRTRHYKPKRFSALGLRSTTTAREYTCSCGHVGWSNHIDLARMAEAEA